MIWLLKIFKKIIQLYERNQFDRLVKMVQFVRVKLETRLAQEGLLARLTARVKSSESLRKKLEKWSEDPKKAARLEGDGELVLRNVSDLAAARVMAYTEADRGTVCGLVQECFSSPSEYEKNLMSK